MKRMSIILSTLIMLCFSGAVRASECKVIVSLNGVAHSILQQSIAELSGHLKRKRVAVIDLNHWQDFPTSDITSGRQRAIYRDKFDLPRHKPAAVLLNRQGKMIMRQEATIDLVGLLLGCTNNRQ